MVHFIFDDIVDIRLALTQFISSLHISRRSFWPNCSNYIFALHYYFYTSLALIIISTSQIYSIFHLNITLLSYKNCFNINYSSIQCSKPLENFSHLTFLSEKYHQKEHSAQNLLKKYQKVEPQLFFFCTRAKPIKYFTMFYAK